MKRGRFLLVVALCLGVLAPAHASESDQSLWIKAEIKRWTTASRVFVSSSLEDEIIGQFSQAKIYLCDRTDAICDKFKLDSARRQIIRRYLSDLLANPATLVSVMSRLLGSAHISLTNIGWTEGPWFNRFVTVPLLNNSATANLRYLHWNGPQAIPSNVERAILPIGLHSLILQTSPSQSAELLVRVSRHGGTPVIENITQRPLTGGALHAPARIEPHLDRYCLDKPVDPAEPMYHTARGRGDSSQGKLSDFHSTDMIVVSLAREVNGCDADCKRWVGADVVQALSQWRAGCTECLPSTLSAIKIGSDLFVADRFVYWAQYQDDQLTAGSTGKPDSYRIATTLAGNGGINSTMGFQRLQETSLLSSLCAIKDGEDSLSSRAKQLLCGSVSHCSVDVGCLPIPVNLIAEPSCSGYIACGFPDHTVSLNTAEFQFSLAPNTILGSNSALLIGKLSAAQLGTPIPLYPVLLHEVGHWFGLPHVDSDKGKDGRDEVMKPTGGDDNVCISRAALIMVSNAIDTNWPFRLKTPGGLRYEPH